MMSNARGRVYALIIAVCLLALSSVVSAGCSKGGPEFVDEGHAYTSDTATSLLESSSAGDLAQTSAAKAPQLRQDALAGLRQRGKRAAEAASIITDAFPANATGVPYYVERATFNGEKAIVILEARGPGAGVLRNRLLWVIDENGGVLSSVMR